VCWLALSLVPTSISLVEVGADFPFPRGAAPQSDGREQAQLLAERAEPASAEGRSLSLVWRSSPLLSTASSSSDSPQTERHRLYCWYSSDAGTAD
jgi:hypothetical protein